MERMDRIRWSNTEQTKHRQSFLLPLRHYSAARLTFYILMCHKTTNVNMLWTVAEMVVPLFEGSQTTA